MAAAAVLAPVGLFILHRPAPGSLHRQLQPRTVRVLAFTVGVVGGIYGIGGGSVLGPILVGTGLTVAAVAPAALFSTWVTSLVGVATYALISLNATGPVSPDGSLGIATGLGGLAGGWVGASLQPRIPNASCALDSGSWPWRLRRRARRRAGRAASGRSGRGGAALGQQFSRAG